VPVGFDHFARPGDALARAVQDGTLRRNFQGFTDDQAPVLVGLGASAITMMPGIIWQNEKNAGRYRMLLSQDRLPASGGLIRSADDQRRGAVIEGILCQGEARLDPDLANEVLMRLLPFIDRELAELDHGTLRLLPEALPYARTIAALFDPYRQDSIRRFSSAV
jgi:oxygen-independent coproporphyrinogen-3 oxidase